MKDTTGARRPQHFHYCLNTSTIRRPGLSPMDALDIAARAGYDGIEPWIRELDQHIASGGSLDEYRRKAADLGLEIVNVIAFIEWAVDDDTARENGWREARRNMEMCRRIGCGHLAAPPYGAADSATLDLTDVAARYRELLDLGSDYGVKPILEFWWMSKKLKRLSEAVFVAIECGHPDASVLADIFHMYRGGSSWEGLRMLSPEALGMVHLNDYPGSPAKDTLTDADRVFPGDGAAPLGRILRDLYGLGYRGFLSLELFNKEYEKMDASSVAREGLAKMKAQVQETLAG
ncbi:MAG: sugar phosphate isomerase/epimerase [Spirochaetales bacterium]|nr:sugar phosphate isomerase/epimerase [Spirochaetales bacterium]